MYIIHFNRIITSLLIINRQLICLIILMLACDNAPDPDDLGTWKPPGHFTEHEKIALLRHCPIAKVGKRISVQGIDIARYNPRRNYDSSVCYVSGPNDTRFLCRVLNFFEIAPCCHLDCEEELVLEIKRYTMRRDRNVPGGLTCKMVSDQKIEYVSAASLQPVTVVLVPTIRMKPTTRSARRAVEKQMKFGPFIVVEVKRKVYQ